MMSYEEMLAGLVAFLTGFEGLTPQRARSMAESILAEKPAWEGR